MVGIMQSTFKRDVASTFEEVRGLGELIMTIDDLIPTSDDHAHKRIVSRRIRCVLVEIKTERTTTRIHGKPAHSTFGYRPGARRDQIASRKWLCDWTEIPSMMIDLACVNSIELYRQVCSDIAISTDRLCCCGPKPRYYCYCRSPVQESCLFYCIV
ncbi:hypothetical protein BGY98DRAFT_980402 [Russula aff. rugulosa BPL654]|nr:hypothetical protein BGY98DRAFT_980402 [Russula aff. rugulosa BPL654]